MTSDHPSRDEMDPAPLPVHVTQAAHYTLQFFREENPPPAHDVWGALMRWIFLREDIEEQQGHGARPTWEQQRDVIRWHVATREAVQRLIAVGTLVEVGEGRSRFDRTRITTYTPSGTGPSEDYPELKVSAPGVVRLSTRARVQSDQEFIYDPDLYLDRMGIEGAHPRVTRALREAVEAFRREVYLAAATMLGSASEGAWLEVFEAFNRWADEHSAQAVQVEQGDLARRVLNAESLLQPARTVLQTAGVDRLAMKGAVLHFDHLREIRNFAVHFDTSERFDLSYPAVAVLMLKSADYFSILYRARAALVDRSPGRSRPG